MDNPNSFIHRGKNLFGFSAVNDGSSRICLAYWTDV